jgi:hypothetical protein
MIKSTFYLTFFCSYFYSSFFKIAHFAFYHRPQIGNLLIKIMLPDTQCIIQIQQIPILPIIQFHEFITKLPLLSTTYPFINNTCQLPIFPYYHPHTHFITLHKFQCYDPNTPGITLDNTKYCLIDRLEYITITLCTLGLNWVNIPSTFGKSLGDTPCGTYGQLATRNNVHPVAKLS